MKARPFALLRPALLAVGTLGLAIAVLALIAWADSATHDAGRPGRLRVALFINGTLGDKSFFDSAARGLDAARREWDVAAKVVEAGTDPTRWEGALTDLADSGDFDVIVAGTFTMVPYVERLSGEFPEAKFIVFDAAVDYARCGCRNVHSLLFRQNEGAWLAGFLAASLDAAGALPGLPAHRGLGVVGGMRFPVIDDFILGFRAGAQAAQPGVAVAAQYANSFSDPAAGKEIAKAQFGRGASLVFHAAGASGQGVNEAALETGRYAIGVDMDQYQLYRGANPALAGRIVTSVLKNVDVALRRAIGQHLAGQLRYGHAESLGLAEGGVSLAGGSQVWSGMPPRILAALHGAEAAVREGRIVVPSAYAAITAAAGERQP
jgi:basic membrane protein A